ncbi:MAG TPA: TolC family protein [Holophagaceae bacterium]|nr:TolC family protein [Holophagaceae bacterium]
MPRPLILSLLCPALAAQAPAPAPAPLPPPAALPGVTELSLADAYRLALENNLQARISRDERDISRFGVQSEEGAFDWTLFAAAGTGRTQLEDANPKSSGLGNIFFSDAFSDQRTRFASLGMGKLFGWGGTATLSVSPFWSSTSVQQQNHPLDSNQITASQFGTVNPYGGKLTLALNQPLLRGFGTDAAEARLKAAQKRAEEGDISYQLSLIRLVATTDNLYWDHVFAVQNLANKRDALALAQKQLDEDSERVKSGMLAPLDLPQVEATVAEREKQVYSAEAEVENTRAALLAQIYADQPRPGELRLADQPGPVPFDRSLDEAERLALENRPEVKVASTQVAERLIQERAAHNRLLPQLDATLAYTGAAKSQDNLGPALTDLLQGQLPGYYVGLALAVPVGNRAARGAYGQARASRHEAELVVSSVRQAILLEVQQAYAALKASEKQVEAAQKALDFRQKSLEAEQDKLENGLSTSFFILQRQDELDQARTALIQAQVDYRKALTGLQRAMGVLLERRLGPSKA